MFLLLDFNYTYVSKESVLFPTEEEKIIFKSKRKNPKPRKLNMKKFTREFVVDLLDSREKSQKKIILENNVDNYMGEVFVDENKNLDFRENNSKSKFSIGQLHKNQVLLSNQNLSKNNSKLKSSEKNGCSKESHSNQFNQNNLNLKNYFNKLKSKKKENFGKEKHLKNGNDGKENKSLGFVDLSSEGKNVEKKLDPNFKSQNEFNSCDYFIGKKEINKNDNHNFQSKLSFN